MEFRPVFRYFKLTTLHNNKSYYFTSIREIFERQMDIEFESDFYTNYKCVPLTYFAKSHTGKCYISKRKKSMCDYFVVQSVFLTPEEFFEKRGKVFDDGDDDVKQ